MNFSLAHLKCCCSSHFCGFSTLFTWHGSTHRVFTSNIYVTCLQNHDSRPDPSRPWRHTCVYDQLSGHKNCFYYIRRKCIAWQIMLKDFKSLILVLVWFVLVSPYPFHPTHFLQCICILTQLNINFVWNFHLRYWGHLKNLKHLQNI